MKIKVINRPCDIDRLVSIKSQLETLELNFDIFEAVEGTRLSDPEYSNHPSISYDRKAALRICGRELSDPEKGCSLSHLMLYREFCQSSEDWLCILEDDAIINSDFPGVLAAIENRPNFEMVLLGHFSRKHWSYELGAETAFFGRRRLLKGVYAEKPVELPLTTCGYVIRKSAAKKLLEFGTPLRLPPDWLTGAAESFGIDLFVIQPPVVLVEQTLHENSTIGDRMAGLVAPIDSEHGVRLIMVKNIHRLKSLIRGVLRFLGRFGIARKSYVWVFNRQGLSHK